jgi:hypothetical protein
MTPVFMRLFGAAASSFGLVTRAAATTKAKDQAHMLLAWLVVRDQPGLRDGVGRLTSLGPFAEATSELYELLDELRRQVPALHDTLSDAALAAAQTDAEAGAHLYADIAQVRETHRREIDSLPAAHPEASALVAVIEGRKLATDMR